MEQEPELDDEVQEQDTSDATQRCPDCDRPNQFGQVCDSCEQDRHEEAARGCDDCQRSYGPRRY